MDQSQKETGESAVSADSSLAGQKQGSLSTPASAAKGQTVHQAPALGRFPGTDQKERDLLTVARGGSLAFAGGVTTRGINYIYSAALVWGLGAGNFGLFTLALAITGFIAVIADVGMGQGIVRFGAIGAQARGRVGVHHATMAALRVVLPVGLLVALALLWSTDLLAESVFRKPQLAPLIAALALSVPFRSLAVVLTAATRAVKIMRCTVVVLAVQALAALLLAIPLLAFNMGLQAVAISYVVSSILAAGLALYYYVTLIYSKEKAQEKFPLGQMVRFSLPLSLSSWTHFANERTEVFFLGLLPSAVDIGIYNIAWRLAGLETIFLESLDQILAPFASDLTHRRALEQLEALYKTTAKWGFTGALAFFLVFALFSERIMLVFDPAFLAGSSVLVALGFAQLLNACTGPCGTVLIMSGHSGISLVNTIALFGISVGLDWLLIPPYGLSGAALAGLLAVVTINLLRVGEVWWLLRIHPFKWSFVKPIVAALSSVALVIGLRSVFQAEGLVMDLAYALLLIVAYMACIYLLKLDAEDALVINAVRGRILGLRPA